jgi:glycine betaine/proline transport system substrate-binding protein
MFKKWMFVTVVALAVGLMFSMPAVADNDMPGKGITVQPARATWSSGFFLEALYSRALEDLGYDVKEPKKTLKPDFL